MPKPLQWDFLAGFATYHLQPQQYVLPDILQVQLQLPATCIQPRAATLQSICGTAVG